MPDSGMQLPLEDKRNFTVLNPNILGGLSYCVIEGHHPSSDSQVIHFPQLRA